MKNQSQRTFDSAKYINQYYKNPSGHQEQAIDNELFQWMEQAFNLIDPCDFGIQIGSGPVLNLAAFSTRKIKNLILTQFNTECFKYIEKWVRRDKTQGTPDWTQNFKTIAKFQGTQNDIAERLRNAIVLCQKIDLRTPQVFEYPFLKKVDIITSSSCIEAVATSNNSFKEIIGNLKKFLKPRGYIFLIGVLEETFYMVQEQRLPCFQVTQELLKETMTEHGFKVIKLNTMYPENPPTVTSDLKGIFSLLAQLVNQK